MSVRITWTNDIGQLGAITLDAAISELHHLGAMVTDHPIEIGPNVADFIRPEPYTLEIEGMISNTPILLPADNSDGAREITVSVEGAQPTLGSTFGRVVPIAGALFASVPVDIPRQKATVKGFDREFDRVKSVFDALDLARARGWLLAVHTRLKVYENMAAESIDVRRDPASGDALLFTLRAKQIRIAKVDLVEVPVLPTAAVSVGNKPTKKGDAVPEIPSQQRSTASQLFGSMP